MAARPPLHRAGWRHYAAQHDQLSRLAGASRILAAPQVQATGSADAGCKGRRRLSDPRFCDIIAT
jgi:hypothetical protein